MSIHITPKAVVAEQCEFVRPHLETYALEPGAIDPESTALVMTHLRLCEHCRSIIDRITRYRR